MKSVKLTETIIPKYYEIFKPKYMHNILTSGRSGTKSSFLAIMAVFRIISDEKQSVIFMRKHGIKLRQTVFAECQRAIGRLGLSKRLFKITKSPMRITYKKTGNSIFFSGSDSVDATKGFIDEERPISTVIIDEVTEFFEHTAHGADELNNIVATFVRANDSKFSVYYAFNPPANPYAPVFEWKKVMERRSDTRCIHSTYLDVPEQWLGKALYQEAEEMKAADEKMFRHVWLGECVGISGLIYYMFDEKRHVQEADGRKCNLFVIGSDWGTQNATVFEAFGLNPKEKKMVGLEEYYYSGRDKGILKTPADYAKDLREFIDGLYDKYGRKVVYMYIDPSASGFIEECRRACPEIIIRKANNDVDLGINRLQKLFAYNKISLSPRQKEFINELHIYSYDEKSIQKGKEKPIKEFDHCCDSCRYATNGIWKYLGMKTKEIEA